MGYTIEAENLEGVVEALLKREDTVQRQYLLQCAEWKREQDEDGPYYVAYSKSANCALYDIDRLYYATPPSNYKIFHYKHNHDPIECDWMECGNLPYYGKTKYFEGTVWTRGFVY